MMTNVYERLRAILADLLVLNPEEIRPDSLLVDDLDADSISFLELWFMLEKEFGLDLPEVKADEEMLNAPLLTGLDRLEAMGGQTTFFEFVRHEIAARSDVGGDSALVREATLAIDRQRRLELAGGHTVGSLAALLGGRPPVGLTPATLVTDLRLRDFFRFLTVSALTEYLTFLLTLKEQQQAAG